MTRSVQRIEPLISRDVFIAMFGEEVDPDRRSARPARTMQRVDQASSI
jgi:hypothetical protein